MKPGSAATADVSMDKYASAQASRRLDRFAFELRRAAKSGDADSIHDLRVSIRRFSQCLRVFGQFFPAREAKKIRRRMRRILDLAAEVRNRDIAVELSEQAGVRPDSTLPLRLSQERKQTEQELVRMLKRWGRRELSAKWRGQLRL
jgi:CHAD domain-containing protein